MVNGLARWVDCQRHGLWAKYVDAGPFAGGRSGGAKGGYSPIDR